MNNVPVIVFGFYGDGQHLLDRDILKDKYPKVDLYNSKNNEIIYGITCTLDNETGKIFTSDSDLFQIKSLYKEISNIIIKGLGYHLVLDN